MKENQVDQIYEAVRKINHAYEVWALHHGLTLYEMQVYYIMMSKEQQRITQKDLCKKLDAPKTSMNSIIKKQVQRGYIELNVNSDNRREKIVTLTNKGKEFAETLILPLYRYEQDAFDTLDKQAVQTTITIQNQFADQLLKKVGEHDE